MKKRIPYRIEHTRNKHSRAVYKDNTIVIRLARGLSAVQHKDHAENLLKRMTKQIIAESARPTIDPFRPFLCDKTRSGDHVITLSSGKTYSLRHDKTSKIAKVRGTPDGFSVSFDDEHAVKTVHKELWKALSTAEIDGMKALVNLINHASFQVDISDVNLKFARSQWGSCAPSGAIMLNAALLFLPEHIQEYVIVHELAHRIHPNHSPDFWSCVESAYADHRRARKHLRAYRITSL